MTDTRSTSGSDETEVSVTGVVTVRYWAAARAAVGLPSEEVAVDGATTLAALRDELATRHPHATAQLAVCSVLVGDRPVGKADPATVVVEPGAVVELLPPFAGG